MEKKTFREFAGADYDTWRRLAEKTLKGKPFSSIITDTYEQVALQPLYTKEHIAGMQEVASLMPQTRHTVAQELTALTTAEMQYKLQQALLNGQDVMHIALDKATMSGQDSNEASGELVLNGGIALNSLDDFESVFKGVDLAKHPVLLHAGYTGLPLLTGLVAYAKQRGTVLSGTIGADPIGYLAETGRLPMPLSACYDGMATAVLWAKTEAPDVRTVFVRTDAYHQAGAHAVQELAAALATAVEYIRALLARGVSADAACRSLTFSFAVGSHLFTEIAKLRAIRVLWRKVAEGFGAGEKVRCIPLHARTSQRTKTIYDPHVNLLRATTEAFAALVGGADTLHVGAYDEAYGGNDENGARWARNLQHILGQESHLLQVVDPARGSYYVEALTAELAEQAWKLFQAIEARGGMSAVIKKGWLQQEIAETAKQRWHNVMCLKQRIVGTNVYVKKDELRPNQKMDPAEQRQRRTLEVVKYKEQRSMDVLRQVLPASFHLSSLETPAALQRAVLAGATIGELSSRFPQGEEQAQPLPAMRDAEPFEVLREAAQRYEERTGRRPQADILRIAGGEKESFPLVVNALEACGYAIRRVQVLPSEDLPLTDCANAVFLAGEEAEVQEVVRLLKAKGTQAKLFVIGSYDAERAAAWKECGVQGCISDPKSLLPFLYELHNELEVTV